MCVGNEYFKFLLDFVFVKRRSLFIMIGDLSPECYSP